MWETVRNFSLIAAPINAHCILIKHTPVEYRVLNLQAGIVHYAIRGRASTEDTETVTGFSHNWRYCGFH